MRAKIHLCYQSALLKCVDDVGGGSKQSEHLGADLLQEDALHANLRVCRMQVWGCKGHKVCS